MTLAFMADAQPTLVDAAKSVLDSVATGLTTGMQGIPDGKNWAIPLKLSFGPLKPFPTASRPRVLALEPSRGAAELAELWNGFNHRFKFEAKIRGLPPPNPQWKPGARFKPHLSLARPVNRTGQREPAQPGHDSVVRQAQASSALNLGTLDEIFIFDTLVLYESILGTGGSRYTPLATASLTQASLTDRA